MRITAKDSVCLIVDYQEKILPAIADRERLIENSVKLLQGLRILGIPMVMTAQYSKGLGVNIPPICEAAGMEKFSDKNTFSSRLSGGFRNGQRQKVCHYLWNRSTCMCVTDRDRSKRNGISAGTGEDCIEKTCMTKRS